MIYSLNKLVIYSVINNIIINIIAKYNFRLSKFAERKITEGTEFFRTVH